MSHEVSLTNSNKPSKQQQTLTWNSQHKTVTTITLKQQPIKHAFVRIFLCDHLLTFRFSLYHWHHQITAFPAAGYLLLRKPERSVYPNIGSSLQEKATQLPSFISLSFGYIREVNMAGKNHVFLIATLLSLLVSSVVAHGGKQVGVTYDERSLIINGKRELLFSGSIHYPRSTPDVIIMFFTIEIIIQFFHLKRIGLICCVESGFRCGQN